MKRSYLYLGGDPLHSGLYADLIQEIEKHDLSVRLVARVRVSPNPVATWRAWQQRGRVGPNRLGDLRERLPGGVDLIPMWNLAPALSLPWLMRLIARRAPEGRVVLHARQMVMVRLALAARRWHPDLRVISELEGDDLAEVDYKRSKVAHPTLKQRILWALERRYNDAVDRRLLLESDAVICISRNLKNALVRRYALTPERAARIHVINTPAPRREFFFDPARRRRIRAALGLDGRYVVIYVGNLRAAWARPDMLAETFAWIRARRSEAFFLVLTPDTDRRHLEPHLSRLGVSPRDVLMRACPHHEIVDHLCAADTGLLLRDRHPMNEAANPGKFGEYALSGLPIVMTDGIGDFSAQMRDCELACVLPGLDDAAAIRDQVQRFCMRDFHDDERLAFSRWSADRFATETAVPRIAELYRTI